MGDRPGSLSNEDYSFFFFFFFFFFSNSTPQATDLACHHLRRRRFDGAEASASFAFASNAAKRSLEAARGFQFSNATAATPGRSAACRRRCRRRRHGRETTKSLCDWPTRSDAIETPMSQSQPFASLAVSLPLISEPTMKLSISHNASPNSHLNSAWTPRTTLRICSRIDNTWKERASHSSAAAAAVAASVSFSVIVADGQNLQIFNRKLPTSLPPPPHE
jgi:hypothetical protein